MPGGFCIFQGTSEHDKALIRPHRRQYMSQDTQQEHISKKRVVYTMPGVDAVTIRRNEPYGVPGGEPLLMDLYYPPDAKSEARTPAVIFATGYSDAIAEKFLGCPLKEMGSYGSWARLAAVSGMVAITYTNRNPAADVLTVLRHVREHGASLQIDEKRVALWSCSSSVPTALSVLMQATESPLRCAVLCYGYMLDRDGFTAVADAAKQWGFANPSAGKSADDLPRDVPLLIARAGRDQTAGLNDTLDRFVIDALTRNLPITCVNHAEAPHAFDLFDDSAISREIIRRILRFLQFHLLPAE